MPSAYYDQPTPGYPKPHYLPDIAPFLPGQVIDLFDRYTLTRFAIEPMDFGIGVVQDTVNPDKISLPNSTSTAQFFAGIIQHEHTDPLINQYNIGLPAKYPLPILRQGHIAARVNPSIRNTLALTEPVCLVLTASANGDIKPGYFTNATSAGVAGAAGTTPTGIAIEIPGLKWVRKPYSYSTTEVLAGIGINLP